MRSVACPSDEVDDVDAIDKLEMVRPWLNGHHSGTSLCTDEVKAVKMD
jgi:hypothetical protein